MVRTSAWSSRVRLRLGSARALATAAAAGVATLLFAAAVIAAPGDLDPSFGTDGRVTVNFTASPSGGFADDAYAVAVQSDRKVIVAGSSLVHHDTGYDTDFALARLLPGGSLDPAFGGGDGLVTLDVGTPGAASQVEEVVVQSDGKIVAVGHAGFQTSPGVLSPAVVVARLTPSGGLDGDFGSGGVARIDVPAAAYGYGATMQPDGKILVAGFADQPLYRAFVVRLLPGGAPDSTFGSNGLVLASIGGPGYDVAVDAGERVLVGGGGIGSLAAARFTPAGSLDDTFGDGGVARLLSGAPFYAVVGQAMAVQSDGRVLVAGSITSSCCSGGAFGAVRWTTDGELDPSFGDDGVALVGFDGFASFGDAASSIVVQENDKIVLGGRSMQLAPGPVTEFALARLDASGQLDDTFGGDGRVTTPFYHWPGFPDVSSSEIMDVALAHDGAVVAAGFSFTGAGSQDFGVARYAGDPVDVSPPTITVPATVTVPATSPAGATVHFEVSAVDDVDGSVPVECSPASGSAFAIGTTRVECEAADAAGNHASAGFDVHVAGALEQIDDMLAIVDEIAHGAGNAIEHQLLGVRRSITKDKQQPACKQLDGVLNVVRAHRMKLTAAQSEALTAGALRVQAVLGC